MNTQVCTPTPDRLAIAADLLRRGELVAFPTETVYGLGADARDPEAVRRIFAAKGRPADNPLIVHIWSVGQLDPLCDIPPKALPLVDAFWPGPLTILMPRKPSIPDAVTAGLPTVAMRMPSHPVARDLLRVSGIPVAAPSANRSGRPSPTSAAHVLEDLGGKIPMILDGGPCTVGLESTVLDLCHGAPCILRPGGITQEMIENVLKEPVSLAGSILRPLGENEVALSPGMRYRHYAPEASIILVEGNPDDVVPALQMLYRKAESAGKKAGVLCFSEHLEALSACHAYDIGSCQDPQQAAHRLFDLLRRMDTEGMEQVFSEVLPPRGVGLAVMNRLGRAAAFHTLDARQYLSSALSEASS